MRILPMLFWAVAAAAAQYTGPTNQAGLEIIKVFEGFSSNFYGDPSGYQTIGYGHTCRGRGCSLPLKGKYSIPLSRLNAEQLLKDDLMTYERCVKESVIYDNLNANQSSALVSFTHSVGCGRFRRSKLLLKLNQGDLTGAAGEFRNFVKSKGVVQQELLSRRAAEKALFAR